MELLDFTPTGVTTMTEDRLPLEMSFYRKAGDGDFLPCCGGERSAAIADGGRRRGG